MSTLLKFSKGAFVLQFNRGSIYPSPHLDSLSQVKDRTAGNELQVEDLGIKIETRVLTFNAMPYSDYSGLRNWFYNVVIGGLNEFQFTDEYGETRTVVFVESELLFDNISMCKYAGKFTLEYR